jgi:SAM-dependent methyltransferase
LDPFDAFYYQHCCGEPYLRNDLWMGLFGRFADRIVADIAPRRVLDAGCALGLLVEALRERGVEAFGLDLSPYAIEHAHDSVKAFCRTGSITGDLGGDFDLIVSIEVVEHMPAREAEEAIANICAHTSDVLFSSSPVDHREPTHINVQQPEYWAEQFARHGFFRDVDYDASFIQPWAVRFRKRAEPLHRIVREYERRYWALLTESNDARGYSRETNRKVAGLEAELSTERDRRAETDQLAGEAQRKAAELEAELRAERGRRAEAEQREGETRRKLAELEAELCAERDQLTIQLHQALDTIHHMERSAFWKVRRVWTLIRSVFSRPPAR